MPFMEETLVQKLINRGVDPSHIEKMQNTTNINTDTYGVFYDINNETEEYQMVDPSKIKGLGFRGTIGLSWFDHACMNGTDNIDLYRCNNALKALEEQSLSDFHSFYKNTRVKLKYFKEDDFYVVNGDGTHRTLWAKVTKAPLIGADVLTVEKNLSTYESYQFFLSLNKLLTDFLDENNLSLETHKAKIKNASRFVYYKGEIIGHYAIFSDTMFNDKKYLNLESLNKWSEQISNFIREYKKALSYRDMFKKVINEPSNNTVRKVVLRTLDWWLGNMDIGDENEKRRFRKQGYKMFCIDCKRR